MSPLTVSKKEAENVPSYCHIEAELCGMYLLLPLGITSITSYQRYLINVSHVKSMGENSLSE